jgi:hypothetical protein
MSSSDIWVVIHPEVTALSVVQVRQMMSAVQKQLTRDFCPAWDLKSVKLHGPTTPKLVPSGVRQLVFLNDADSPGALGYHSDDTSDAPVGKVFVKTIMKYNASVSVTFSHEVLEMVADAWANYWADNGKSTLYALEVCDPVEEQTYKVGTVDVSNFVLPSYFDATVEAGCSKFDFLSSLKAPFSLASGGYVIKQAGGKITQQFAKAYPAWRKRMKKLGKSRSAKRGALK